MSADRSSLATVLPELSCGMLQGGRFPDNIFHFLNTTSAYLRLYVQCSVTTVRWNAVIPYNFFGKFSGLRMNSDQFQQSSYLRNGKWNWFFCNYFIIAEFVGFWLTVLLLGCTIRFQVIGVEFLMIINKEETARQCFHGIQTWTGWRHRVLSQFVGKVKLLPLKMIEKSKTLLLKRISLTVVNRCSGICLVYWSLHSFGRQNVVVVERG